MMRALWTSASGMTSQQLNVDTISNNLANVNTAGYKKEGVTFKSLLYSKLEQPNIPGQPAAPAPMQVGHGVKPGANVRNYSGGVLKQTDTTTDLAIEGDGFFTILKGEEPMYTRDGSFRFANTEGGMRALVTTDGYPVLSTDDEPILVDAGIKVEDVIIDKEAAVYYLDPDTKLRVDIAQIKLVQFPNREGLEAVGSNLYIETPASGVPIVEADGEDTLVKSQVRSSYLEGSNVQVAEEMVNLIVAQRAYELNSTAIKTADTMLQQANELKRG